MTGRHKNPSARVLAGYQCTKEDWLTLRDIGLEMIAAGSSQDATPLRAYQHQRFAAVSRRDIGWNLSLMDWWKIWQDSGHWSDRGQGRGYMMCRKGDVGAYEIGNVFIGLGVENLSAATKKTDLPIGVAYMKKGVAKPFRAYCNIQGKQRHIGLFATPEEAERAYLQARALDDELGRIVDQRIKDFRVLLQRGDMKRRSAA